jgi:hypothetical protein
MAISYNLVNIGTNRWEYQYSVGNNLLAAPIEEFSIYFDLGPGFNVLHTDLTITGLPADWDGLLLPPDSGIPHSGLFDALAIGGRGIGPNELLDGFAVQFTYHGLGSPGPQRFEIIDPVIFNTLESGFTFEGSPPPVAASEPSSLALLLAAALGALLLTRRRNTSRNRP